MATFPNELPRTGANDGADALASRVAAGDRDAFVAVYRAHFANVRAFARRLLGDAMTADDLVHDVFESLPRALRSFRGECPLGNYLIAMAARLAKNHVRSAKRRRKHEERAATEPLANSASQPDRDAEQRELARLLTAALDELPMDQRVAFVLCEVEERTSAEVAELLGEQAGTIRARVFHAKRKLRVRLDGAQGGPDTTVERGGRRE